MPITDEALLKMMFDKHEGQPIEFIMEEYGKAKRRYLEIEQELAQGTSTKIIEVERVDEPKKLEQGDKAVKKAERVEKHYTKDDLVSDPAEAIHDDYIVCCLCNKHFDTLGNHISSQHQIWSKSYRKLCGYPDDLPLMSKHEAMKAKGRGKNLADGNAEKRAPAKVEQEAATAAE